MSGDDSCKLCGGVVTAGDHIRPGPICRDCQIRVTESVITRVLNHVLFPTPDPAVEAVRKVLVLAGLLKATP